MERILASYPYRVLSVSLRGLWGLLPLVCATDLPSPASASHMANYIRQTQAPPLLYAEPVGCYVRGRARATRGSTSLRIHHRHEKTTVSVVLLPHPSLYPQPFRRHKAGIQGGLRA